MRLSNSILLVCVYACLLSACGNKGSLYLPGEAADSQPAVTPEATEGIDPLDRDEDKEKENAKEDDSSSDEDGPEPAYVA